MFKVRQKLTQFSLETSIAEVKNICLFFSKKKGFRSFQICFYFNIFFSLYQILGTASRICDWPCFWSPGKISFPEY
jgi:hypothetical protein